VRPFAGDGALEIVSGYFEARGAVLRGPFELVPLRTESQTSTLGLINRRRFSRTPGMDDGFLQPQIASWPVPTAVLDAETRREGAAGGGLGERCGPLPMTRSWLARR